MVSNSFKEKVVAGMLATSFIIPAFAFADNSTTTAPSAREMKNFCATLPALRTKSLARLTERVTTVQGKKGDHQAKFQAGRTLRHDKLAADRTTHDTDRQTHYAKLMTRASTTEQKAAVTTFETTVENLVTVRKAAVDVAIKTFEDGVLVLEMANDTAVTDMSTTIQADINKIFDDATASCVAGKTGSEVRTQVQVAMEAIRTARAADKKAHVAGDQFKTLQAVRKASVDAAMATFKTGMDAATVDLKKAFTK